MGMHGNSMDQKTFHRPEHDPKLKSLYCFWTYGDLDGYHWEGKRGEGWDVSEAITEKCKPTIFPISKGLSVNLKGIPVLTVCPLRESFLLAALSYPTRIRLMRNMSPGPWNDGEKIAFGHGITKRGANPFASGQVSVAGWANVLVQRCRRRVSRASKGFNFPYLSPQMRVVFPLSVSSVYHSLPHNILDRPRIRAFRGNFFWARVPRSCSHHYSAFFIHYFPHRLPGWWSKSLLTKIDSLSASVRTVSPVVPRKVEPSHGNASRIVGGGWRFKHAFLAKIFPFLVPILFSISWGPCVHFVSGNETN